jgi:hypothetical protein
MSEIQHPEFDKFVQATQPDIERLVRRVDSASAACITGFVFGMHPRGLIKFGNIENRGENLIQLHLVLASLTATMQELPKGASAYHDVPFIEIDAGKDAWGQAPEELADTLARMVLITGMDASKITEIMEVAQRYLMARRPPEEKKQ